jgi:hypothetical protein
LLNVKIIFAQQILPVVNGKFWESLLECLLIRERFPFLSGCSLEWGSQGIMDVEPREVGAEEFEDLKMHSLKGPGLIDPHDTRNAVGLNLYI